MTSEWCDFNDMPKDGCAHCHPPEAPAVEHERPLLGTIIVARKNGECPVCGDPIRKDVDHIGAIIDNGKPVEWAHYGCGR